ncbi:hypothetical protein LTR51_005914 [Lithohypha guttulata]|nr:hypothetical protein LTR51_005914 [Lithohypha guttulata]
MRSLQLTTALLRSVPGPDPSTTRELVLCTRDIGAAPSISGDQAGTASDPFTSDVTPPPGCREQRLTRCNVPQHGCTTRSTTRDETSPSGALLGRTVAKRSDFDREGQPRAAAPTDIRRLLARITPIEVLRAEEGVGTGTRMWSPRTDNVSYIVLQE